MDKRNAEHYYDPTASEAINNISEREQQIGLLVKGIKCVVRAAGCELVSRVEIKDTTTGRVYR